MLGMPRILSRPFGIEWAGWRSDTLKLQSYGWQIAVEHDYYRHGYRLLLRHRDMQLYAMSDRRVIEQFMRITSPSYHEEMPVFNVIHVAPNLMVERIRVDADFSFKNFEEIDAIPCYTTSQIESAEDTNIFNVPRTRTEEILVNKADMTVIEHLEAIKKLQQPGQDEIRARMRGRQENIDPRYRPRTEMIAQLVHYADAA